MPSSMRRWISATASRLARALRESGRDFGHAPHQRRPRCTSSSNCRRKSRWNQKQLGEIAERIVASRGEKVEGYLDIKLSVSESRYTQLAAALLAAVSLPRGTVDAGKPSFTS